MILKLTNNLTKTEYQFNVEDKYSSTMFFSFDIVLPDGIKDGEYSYQLLDDKGVEVATGLAQIGEYTPKKTTYENNKKIVQYNG